MDIQEIFGAMKKRALEGMVFHDEMVRYYSFLNLKGFKKCHEYRYSDETDGYRDLCDYYVNHFDALLPDTQMQRPDVIPSNWYNYTRQDVDKGTLRSAIKTGAVGWVEWEKETKRLYEQMYIELLDIGEVAAAEEVTRYVRDVDEELDSAEKHLLVMEAVDYDLSVIIPMQDKLHKQYTLGGE